VLYSEGFNPHPKLSLPLPRSVGIEVDNDLLCFRMESTAQESDLCDSVKAGLSEQLPDGVELLAVRTAKAKTPIQPCQAVYLLVARKEYLNEKLKSRIKCLLASKNLNLQRQMGPENSKFKNVDVRPFLKSIELLEDAVITVECKISPTGSICVDEILGLLELDYGMLSAPIRRARVQWQESNS
jgi:radical SAM-linked protein